MIDTVNAKAQLNLRQDDSPELEDMGWRFEPGTYVVYGMARRVTVEFGATCIGSGEQLSGIATSWESTGSGSINCEVDASDAENEGFSGTPARNACPEAAG